MGWDLVSSTVLVTIFIPATIVLEFSIFTVMAILPQLGINVPEVSGEAIKIIAGVIGLVTSTFASWLMYEKARKLKIDNDIKRLEEKNGKLHLFVQKKKLISENPDDIEEIDEI